MIEFFLATKRKHKTGEYQIRKTIVNNTVRIVD